MSLILLSRQLLSHKSGIVAAVPNHKNLFRRTFARGQRSLPPPLWPPPSAGGDSTPNTNRTTAPTKSSRSASSAATTPKPTYNVSICSIQGAREYMEDEYFVNRPQNTFFGVFDGHGGPAVSRYLRQNLYAHVLHCYLDTKQEVVLQQSNTSQTTIAANVYHQKYAQALEQALGKVDKEVCSISHWSYQGSTAVVAWLLHAPPAFDDADQNSNNNKYSSQPKQQCWLVVANIGDSRAVLCRNGTAVPLTKDHKPNRPSERKRIEDVGGTVENCDGVHRVNGILALSRAIGDVSDRPAISAEPEMVSIQIHPNVDGSDNEKNADSMDEFVLLATDGLWEVFTTQSAVKFVRSQIRQQHGSWEDISQILVREALRRGSTDNITVLIVWLQEQE